MTRQLNLLGAPDLPEDLELGTVQREVMRVLRELDTVTRDEAGAISHAHRGKHGVDDRCAYCALDGNSVLASLLKRGLVEKTVNGAVQLPQPLTGSADFGDIPF